MIPANRLATILSMLALGTTVASARGDEPAVPGSPPGLRPVVGQGGKAKGPTFNKDVAPILWKNCAGCHRAGEVGPFPLITYKDTVKRADFVAEIIQSKRMPPWQPEPGFGTFHDERRLSDTEIKTITDWAESGAVEGDPHDLKTPPSFPEGWQLGTPDLILKASASFDIPASGRDVYRCFVIPIPTETDRTVAAVEFRPGNNKIVHHAIFFLDNTGAARKKDAEDEGLGYSGFGGPGFLPTGALGGWAPGAMPRMLPDGMGRLLRKGSDLVLQVHYHPDGKPESDQSTVGIYFTKKPARQIVGGFRVAPDRQELNIPAGEKHFTITAETEPLPVEVDVVGITPHMHYLGKEMKVVAETPDGKIIPLIWIKDWDFNWQGQYQFKSPVKLSQGTVVKLEAAYDNSSDNPRNPSNPPKRVHWGEQTTDEMTLAFVQVVTEKNMDLLKLLTMRGRGLRNALGGGRPAETPRNRAEAGGFLIPEARKELLGRFDKNDDGRLSNEEIEAIPEPARERIKAAIRARMGDTDTPRKP